MSVQSLDALKQQSSLLTAQEKIELAEYLLRQAKQSSPETASGKVGDETKRRLRREWLAAHGETYAGQYVALDGDRLIGTGKNYTEAAAAAKRAGVSDAYIDYIHPPEGVGFIGGW
jgi:hypothetical protein